MQRRQLAENLIESSWINIVCGIRNRFLSLKLDLNWFQTLAIHLINDYLIKILATDATTIKTFEPTKIKSKRSCLALSISFNCLFTVCYFVYKQKIKTYISLQSSDYWKFIFLLFWKSFWKFKFLFFSWMFEKLKIIF